RFPRRQRDHDRNAFPIAFVDVQLDRQPSATADGSSPLTNPSRSTYRRSPSSVRMNPKSFASSNHSIAPLTAAPSISTNSRSGPGAGFVEPDLEFEQIPEGRCHAHVVRSA